MMLPYLNSASYNALMRSGVFNSNQNSQSTNKNQTNFDITSTEKTSVNAVIQPELNSAAPVVKSKDSAKSFLEMNKPTKTEFRKYFIEDTQNSSANSYSALVENSETEISFYLYDPNLMKGSKKTNQNDESEKLRLIFNPSLRKKPGSLVDLRI